MTTGEGGPGKWEDATAKSPGLGPEGKETNRGRRGRKDRMGGALGVL